MRGYQVPGFEDVPKGIGNEVGLQSARVPAEFLVDAGEDNLAAGAIPLNLHGAVRVVPVGVEDHRSAGIVMSHHQIEHGVVQGAVNTVGVQKVAVIQGALPLGVWRFRRMSVRHAEAQTPLSPLERRPWGKKGPPP